MVRLIRQYVGNRGVLDVLGKQDFASMQKLYHCSENAELITSRGSEFIDSKERKTLYRGINIAAKIPLHFHETSSYTGTPFSIKDAPEHFVRLRYLGFNLLRWVVPWEALCPIKAGSYDKKYLSYLDQVISLAGDYGFSVLIDFHQDVWSRYTGGSGAPLWTMSSVGFKPENFEKCLAFSPQWKDTPYPLGHLFWATNADRYAAKTMYTLFFGGKTFAPDMKVEKKSVQDFLQNEYLNAITLCAKTLKKHKHVIGFDIMNEPHLGFIGCKDLNKYHGLFRLGPSPLPIQSFTLAEGHMQLVDIYEKKMFGLKKSEQRVYDPKNETIFQDGVCFWRKQGVWGYKEGGPVLLRKNYFSTADPNKSFYRPFIQKVIKALSDIDSEKISFIEHATNHPIPEVKDLPYKVGFSGHWYDAFVISMRKVWNFIAIDMFTQKVKISLPVYVQSNLAFQIQRLLKKVQKCVGNVPFLLSEFGIPFDLNKKKAYDSGDYANQKVGLERSFKAVEKTQVSSIIWNYTAYNTNEKGDLWNNEDFSIFSLDQITNSKDPYSGVRAKEAVVRAYPIKIPGKMRSYTFDSFEGFFSCIFEHDESNDEPLEIFLPTIHFGRGFELQMSDGRHKVDYLNQRLLFYPDSHRKNVHKVNILKKRQEGKEQTFLPFF